MYNYRKLSPEEKQAVVESRRARGFPLHAPPRRRHDVGDALITAACYEHRPIFDDPRWLGWLSEEVLSCFAQTSVQRLAWVFLPTHYHVLLHQPNMDVMSEALRKLHSRLSTRINSIQHTRGRRVWYRFSDRNMRSEGHLWATINYIHLNPVKHGFVDEIAAWPWSSYPEYLEHFGEGGIERMIAEYPIDQYGKGWDI